MSADNSIDQPAISHAEPVLAVNSIMETVAYWHDTLGFPDKWAWGDPPVHGGVSWHGVFIQFTCNPGLAERSKGNSVWIRVRNIEALYEFHKSKNVKIAAPLELQPYGMAQYTACDNNGYYIHFAGTPVSVRGKSELALPLSIRVVARMPTSGERQRLASAVFNTLPSPEENNEMSPGAIVYAVVAEDTASGQLVGCAFLLGDQAGFYYIRNVMVDPEWQGKRIGTALMQEITGWLENNATDDSMIALHTPENLAPFYRQFNFLPSFSMIRIMKRKK